MKSLEEFTQAGEALYGSIQRAELTGHVNERDIRYYSLQERIQKIGIEHYVTGQFTDEQKPLLQESTLNEFVGGLHMRYGKKTLLLQGRKNYL